MAEGVAEGVADGVAGLGGGRECGPGCGRTPCASLHQLASDVYGFVGGCVVGVQYVLGMAFVKAQCTVQKKTQARWPVGKH